MTDDLVERVEAVIARQMMKTVPYDPGDRMYLSVARAAIAVLRPALRADALEEAAKVAENASFQFTQTTPSTVEVVDVRQTIAAAIRALVKHG